MQASTKKYLEQQKRDREQQKIDAAADADLFRQIRPPECHDGYKCRYAQWLHDVDQEVGCTNPTIAKVNQQPVPVKTLTACPHACWDSEPAIPGCHGEAIAEAKRVMWESSRAVLELEAEIGNLIGTQQNLALLEMNMKGKFQRLLADCRAKKGDPSKQLDQSIWREGGERVRQETQPHIDKLEARLRFESRRRAEAIEVLAWLLPQILSPRSPEFWTDLPPEAVSSVMSTSFPPYLPTNQGDGKQ